MDVSGYIPEREFPDFLSLEAVKAHSGPMFAQIVGAREAILQEEKTIVADIEVKGIGPRSLALGGYRIGLMASLLGSESDAWVGRWIKISAVKTRRGKSAFGFDLVPEPDPESQVETRPEPKPAAEETRSIDRPRSSFARKGPPPRDPPGGATIPF